MNAVVAYRLGDDCIDAAAFDGRRFAAHPRSVPLRVRLTLGGRWEATSTSGADLPAVGALLGIERVPEIHRLRGLRREGDRVFLGRHEASLLDVIARAFQGFQLETGWHEAQRLFIAVPGAAERVETLHALVERLGGSDRVVLVDTADAHLAGARRSSLGKTESVLVVEVDGVDTRLTLFGTDDGVHVPVARRSIADHGEISLRAKIVEQLAECYGISLAEEGRRALLETTLADFDASPLQPMELPLMAERLGATSSGPLVLHQEEVDHVTGRYLWALRLAAASLSGASGPLGGVLVAGGAMARDRTLIATLAEATGAPIHSTQASPSLAAALVSAPRHLTVIERRSLARPLSSIPPRARRDGAGPDSLPPMWSRETLPGVSERPLGRRRSSAPPSLRRRYDSDQLAGRAAPPERSGTLPKIVPGAAPPEEGSFRNPTKPADWVGLSLREGEGAALPSVASLLFWLVRARATGTLVLSGRDGTNARVGFVAGRLWTRPAQRVAIQDVLRSEEGTYTFTPGKSGSFEGAVRASTREIVIEAVRRQSWAWDDELVAQALERFRPMAPFLRLEVSQLGKLGLTPVEERFLERFDGSTGFGLLADRQEAVGARGLIFLCLVLSLFELVRWRKLRAGKLGRRGEV